MAVKLMISAATVSSAIAGTVAATVVQAGDGFVFGPGTWIPLGGVIAAIGAAVTATWWVFRYVHASSQIEDTVERLHGDVAMLMTLMLGERDPRTGQRVNGYVQRFDDRGKMLDKMDRKIDRLLALEDGKEEEEEDCG